MFKGFSLSAATRLAIVAAAITSGITSSRPALAQEVSENRGWQFETPQEVAARAAVTDLLARARAGVYGAPVYNTTIARQYNCSVTASAVGNSDTQSATANSPTVTGASSSATGNAGTAEIAGDRTPADIALDQRNGGAVGSSAARATGASADGAAWQALNSSQSNGGDQRASVRGSTACGFGALN